MQYEMSGHTCDITELMIIEHRFTAFEAGHTRDFIFIITVTKSRIRITAT
jgi:hypothetical protein